MIRWLIYWIDMRDILGDSRCHTSLDWMEEMANGDTFECIVQLGGGTISTLAAVYKAAMATEPLDLDILVLKQ